MGELDSAFVRAVAGGRVEQFGHREHVRLAFALVSQHGVERAVKHAGEILSHLAAAHGEPERFHVTLTEAWVRAVAHHMTLAPELTEFDRFIGRFPRLLTTDLLDAHYSREAMFSDLARRTFVEPDRRPIPA